MSQTSYPVVNADHTGAQWRTVQDIGDGIVNDLDGSAYALTVTGSDTCTIGLGTYRVDGTAHEIHTGAETVTLAAVATPTTYLIGIKVDFSVETTPAQLSLVSGVKATLLGGLTGSQRIVPLYEIDRSASTVLSASPRRDYRVWAAEQAYAATLAAASADAPIGAILRTPEGVRLRHLVSGVPAWATLDLKPSAAITPAVGWAAYAGGGPQARVTADGLLVLSGLVSRTGTTVTMTGGTTHHIGTLPAGMRTLRSRYSIMQTSAGAANLIVDVDGRLLLRAPAPSSGASSLSVDRGLGVPRRHHRGGVVMGELSTKSIIGLWTEEPDPADPTQVVRPPAGTTVNVWDYETGAPLAPVVTGQRGYIPPTDYPGVRVFAVSTGPDFAAATVAFPSETLMGAIVDAGLTADVSEAWPTYAHPYVGERHRHFDPIKGHYHASPDDAGWRTKLLGTRRGFRSTTISIMGSSSVAGQSSPGLLSWGLLMRDRLAAAGMGVQGTGVTYAGQAFAVSDPRWTFSAGGVAQVSVRLSATIDNTSWAQFASDIAGQNVKIHYQHDGGSFTYSIDGGAAVAVTTNGSATNGVVTVTGLSNATHTVKVTGANATATKLIGIEVYSNTNGLNVSVAGVGGSVTANWVGSTYSDNWTMARLRVPALTIVAMGGNDATTAVPLATFKANLEGIIGLNTYSSSGTLLVVMPHANTVDLATYRTYVSAMYDVADSEGVNLVDMSHRWGSLTQATAGNLMVDTVHPNTAGHEDYASAVAAMILG